MNFVIDDNDIVIDYEWQLWLIIILMSVLCITRPEARGMRAVFTKQRKISNVHVKKTINCSLT